MARTILVIDDEENMRWVLKRALEKSGYEVVTSSRGDHALKFFAARPVDLILLDLKMPGMDGLSVLRELRERSTSVPILLLTAYATVPTAIEATKLGATDYLRKPFDLEDVLMRISRYLLSEGQSATDGNGAGNEHAFYGRTPDADEGTAPAGFQLFIGTSSVLNRPLALAKTAAETNYTILIRGEAGSGRRHLATLIHTNALVMRKRPFVSIDCDCLPLPLLEQELLDVNATELQDAESRGDPGSHNSGTQESTPVTNGGRWQQALGGTLLLANVDALPEPLLDRLVTQLSSYMRTPQRPFGLRLILTCTESLPPCWHPLLEMAITIELPPLRQRLDDLPLLLTHIAPAAEWEPTARQLLTNYEWPGNVAELKQVVQQVYLLAHDQPIDVSHLPPHIIASGIADGSMRAANQDDRMTLPADGIDLEALEKDLIVQALAMANGNKAHAARLLGLTRATLLYRIDKHGLTDEAA